MKTLYWIFGIAIVLVGGFAFLNKSIYEEKQSDATDAYMSTQPVHITPISHATMVIQWGQTIIYTDPVGGKEAFEGQPAPDIILVTDIHADHFDAPTIKEVLGDATLIVPKAVQDLLPGADLKARAEVLANGQTLSDQNLSFLGVPMYNLPESTDSRHVKGRGNGYVIERDGFRIYVAGDTSATPEMRALTNIDIAFMPMNPPFTMTVEEAADATLAFAPQYVYPFHYRSQTGLSDVTQFKTLVNTGNPDIRVILADWYPTQ
jgi:L-ascorbate metabolism protein UlaG (beta-lactamase superfamily)